MEAGYSEQALANPHLHGTMMTNVEILEFGE